jgi:hypothetical protein
MTDYFKVVLGKGGQGTVYEAFLPGHAEPRQKAVVKKLLCVAIVRRRLGTRIQLRRSSGVNCAAFRDSITITALAKVIACLQRDK